jgi:Histidine kinase
MSRQHIRILFHITAWVIFLLSPFLFFLPVDVLVREGPLVFFELLVIDVLLISFYYFNYFIAIPRYFFSRKYLIYFSILTAWLFVIIFIRHNMDLYPAPPTAKGGFMGTSGVLIFRFSILAVISFGEKTYDRWKQTEAAKLRAELSYLKAQVNPHFLFNTLNSLYVLALKKSDAAPAAIAKLSSIMRYVIEEAEHDQVPVEKELKYISDYIDLQRLRLTSSVQLECNVQGDVKGKVIAPLVLLPVIENAFKHGVSTEEDSWIKITTRIVRNELNLSVANKKIKLRADDKSGKGIKNIKQRLDLIYPQRHLLEIHDNENDFCVSLKILL